MISNWHPPKLVQPGSLNLDGTAPAPPNRPLPDQPPAAPKAPPVLRPAPTSVYGREDRLFKWPTEVQARPTYTVFDYALAVLYHARKALAWVSWSARPTPQGTQAETVAHQIQSARALAAFDRALDEAAATRSEPWAFHSSYSSVARPIRSGAEKALLAAERAVTGLDHLNNLRHGNRHAVAPHLARFATNAGNAVDRHAAALTEAVFLIRDEYQSRWGPTFPTALHRAAGPVLAQASRMVATSAAELEAAATRPCLAGPLP